MGHTVIQIIKFHRLDDSQEEDVIVTNITGDIGFCDLSLIAFYDCFVPVLW